MNKRLSTIIALIALVLTACGNSTPIEVTATFSLPTATVPPTFTSTPEPTFTPTTTPTPRLPVLPGTQIPTSDSTISADNIDQIVELARWGKGVITDAEYSPDGESIAVASTLGVSIYQTDVLEEILYFETEARVNSFAFSPDGKTIATALNDNTLKLWNASDGNLIRSLAGQSRETTSKNAEKEEITSVSFSPDGNQLAGGSTNGTVSLWQALDGSVIGTFNHTEDEVVSVFFSPDGQSLFFASRDGKVRMINVLEGTPPRVFTAGRDISEADISADGKILSAYNPIDGQSLFLWDTESGEKLQTVEGIDRNYSEELHMALSPDGQYVAVAYQDYTAKIWNVPSGVAQNTFEDLTPKDGWYYLQDFVISFSPDSQSLLLAGADSIGIWSLKNSLLLNNAKIKTELYGDIALSPDESMIAVVEGPNVNLIQFSNGSLLSTQDPIQSNGSLAFSPDGATLLVSMFDETARLWPLSDQGIKKIFETEQKEYIRAVAFSPDGQMLAMEETYTGTVELRNVSDGSLIRSMEIGTSYGLGSLVFSPDGKYLAAALNDQTRLFQVEDGKTIRLFNKGGLGIAFSPDGTLLAGGDRDKVLKVWNIPGGEVLFTLKDRPDVVWTTVFSPDGKLLAVGTIDGTIEIFLVADGTLLKSWKGHSSGVNDLLFTTDGKLLISSSGDGTIRAWGLKP